jgi:hypothetical protein
MTDILPDNRARQGPKGRPVLMVLVGSLILLGVYMVSLMLWSGAESPDHSSQNASRQTVTGSPSGSGSNPSDRTPSANPAYPAPTDPSSTGTTKPAPR